MQQKGGLGGKWEAALAGVLVFRGHASNRGTASHVGVNPSLKQSNLVALLQPPLVHPATHPPIYPPTHLPIYPFHPPVPTHVHRHRHPSHTHTPVVRLRGQQVQHARGHSKLAAGQLPSRGHAPTAGAAVVKQEGREESRHILRCVGRHRASFRQEGREEGCHDLRCQDRGAWQGL